MCIWCIKIGIVLVLHSTKSSLLNHGTWGLDGIKGNEIHIYWQCLYIWVKVTQVSDVVHGHLVMSSEPLHNVAHDRHPERTHVALYPLVKKKTPVFDYITQSYEL
jgi:hypothetical protein